MTFSMLNKWEYDPEGEFCYGEEIVYKKARDFLGDTVEDWGCGTGWAGHYFENYNGIDGSLSGYVKEITDLTKYTSKADNILLRQVLEHNYEWKKIVENAKNSFQKKLCITIHTPLSDNTHVLSVSEYNGVPDISFKLEDITNYFSDCIVTQETIPTNFEYGEETIICITK